MKDYGMKRLAVAVFAVAVAWGLVAGYAVAAEKAPDKAAAKATSDPYPLTTCIVSGKKLGDKPVVKTIDGREVKFCCENCPAKLDADKASYMKKLDAAIVEKEKPTYSAATCPVSGQKLGAMGEPVDKVIGNRLVRFCCDGCPAKYEADPAKYGTKLDEAIIAAQKDKYPLDTCLVSGEKLGGDMGKPIDIVVENRLVRLCCSGCRKDLMKDPDKYLAKLDDAAKSKPAPSATSNK